MAVDELVVSLRLDTVALGGFVDAANKVIEAARAAGVDTAEVEAAILNVAKTATVNFPDGDRQC